VFVFQLIEDINGAMVSAAHSMWAAASETAIKIEQETAQF
jgi:hypothetical protein